MPTDVTINYNRTDRKPEFAANSEERDLTKNETFDVKLSWPAECKIEAVEFFNKLPKTDANKLGEWTNSENSANVHSIFQVTKVGDKDVKIEDIEDLGTKDQDKYYYSVKVAGPTANPGPWELDPVIINKKKT